MGWWATASFLNLNLSREELSALDAGKASRETLKKVAKLDIPKSIGEGLTRFFQRDADTTSEVYDDKFKTTGNYAAGKLILEVHDFSMDEYENAWNEVIENMKSANERKYNQLTRALQLLLGRERRGNVLKARARIEWTIVDIEDDDWSKWDWKFLRRDNLAEEADYPRDRSFDVAIELTIVLP